MKKKQLGMKIFFCLLLVLALGIEAVEITYIQGLKREMTRQRLFIDDMRNMVDDMENTFVEHVADPAGLIKDSRQERIGTDLEKRTVTERFVVTPRKVSQSQSAVLVVDERSFPMTKMENGDYIADVDIHVFKPVLVTKVVFRENGQEQTEDLGAAGSYARDFFPWVTGGFSGSSSLKKTGNERKYKIRGSVKLYRDFWQNKELQPENIVVKIEVNGTVVEEIPVKGDEDKIPLRLSVPIPAESAYVDLVIEATDHLGYSYRDHIFRTFFDEKGDVITSHEEEEKCLKDGETEAFRVRDRDGTVVYELT